MGRLSRQLLAQEHEESMRFSKSMDDSMDRLRNARLQKELQQMQGQQQIEAIKAKGGVDKELQTGTQAHETKIVGTKIGAEERMLGTKVGAEKGMQTERIGAEKEMLGTKVGAEKEMLGTKVGAEKEMNTERVSADRQTVADKLQADKDRYHEESRAKRHATYTSGDNPASDVEAIARIDAQDAMEGKRQSGTRGILLDEAKRTTEYSMKGFSPEQRRMFLATAGPTVKEAYADELKAAEEEAMAKKAAKKKGGLLSF